MSETALTAQSFEFLRSREIIRRGSKSFSLASQLFSAPLRSAAHALYVWCRFCDDAIDRVSANERQSAYQYLLNELATAYGETIPDSRAFRELQSIVSEYDIPEHYPRELIEGMGMDARGIDIEDERELLLYCYRVAGVVGLMMTHIMGVNSEAALQHANAMGTAMQLTNIARDIYEDARDNRVYLPRQWREEIGLTDAASVLALENRGKVLLLVKRLLELADTYYLTGDAGVKYLPFSAALAVVSARKIYSQIGTEIRLRGEAALSERVFTSKWTKMKCVVTTLFLVGFARLFSKTHSAVAIKSVWRFD